MALLNITVPTVMRCPSLNLEHIPAEARPVYDRWLTYLLCREGYAAYFHPEGLTYYRVHEAQQSDGLSVNKCAAELYCSKQFMADSRLSAIRPQLQKMLHHHYVDLGIELLIEGRRSEGRFNLIKGFRGAPRRALPFLTLTALFSRHRVSSFIRTFRKEQKSTTQFFRAAFR